MNVFQQSYRTYGKQFLLAYSGTVCSKLSIYLVFQAQEVRGKAMRRKSSLTASYNTAEEGRKVFFIAVKSSIMVFLKATEAKEARIHKPL